MWNDAFSYIRNIEIQFVLHGNLKTLLKGAISKNWVCILPLKTSGAIQGADPLLLVMIVLLLHAVPKSQIFKTKPSLKRRRLGDFKSLWMILWGLALCRYSTPEAHCKHQLMAWPLWYVICIDGSCFLLPCNTEMEKKRVFHPKCKQRRAT